jgi:hypothetical protein
MAEGQDPPFMFAPGLVREAFKYTAGSFHSGDIPEWQTHSREMRRWLGDAHQRQGHAFADEVGGRLRELGWRVELEVKLTKLVGSALQKDFGDVDVLAWNVSSGRVLLVECKDLQYRKTMGEVAEQLADYRGEMRRDGKPDDLRKHLDRVAVLQANVDRVGRQLNLAVRPQLEGHLVFKNPVPMKFAWRHMTGKIHLSLFSDLDQL